MSATITRELVTYERKRAYAHIFGWGHAAWCTQCWHADPPPAEIAEPFDPSSSVFIDGEWRSRVLHCAQCGVDLTQSIEIVEAWAEVEHFTCKIF